MTLDEISFKLNMSLFIQKYILIDLINSKSIGMSKRFEMFT